MAKYKRLSVCGSCSMKISASAEQCPGCGNTDPFGREERAKRWTRIFAGTMIVAAAGAVAVLAQDLFQDFPRSLFQ